MDYNLEKIERYIRKEMSGQELSDFQSELEQDPDLRKAVVKMQLISDAIELDVENDLRSQLGTLRNPAKIKDIRRPSSSLRWLIAAAIMALVAVSMWMLVQTSNSLDQFVQNEYINYSDINLRSEGSNSKSPGLQLIYDGQDEEAISWYRSHLVTEPQDYESRFILADLYKKQNQIDQSKAGFLILARSESLLWKDRAAWNYLLLSVNSEWDPPADEILDSMIKDPGHAYHELAVELADQRN
ncbi:MAG: hypothetical protein KDC80_23130 [Saprospiraceae bacterium]|nr:hypothetical protein [Saprospiraceae bacterium]